jgi:hypothetical protein
MMIGENSKKKNHAKNRHPAVIDFPKTYAWMDADDHTILLRRTDKKAITKKTR